MEDRATALPVRGILTFPRQDFVRDNFAFAHSNLRAACLIQLQGPSATHYPALELQCGNQLASVPMSR
jgi:hypothetical protein